MSMFSLFSRNYVVLFSFDRFLTWWPHDNSLIMALMLSPRHNGIHDCIISNNAMYILILIHKLLHCILLSMNTGISYPINS